MERRIFYPQELTLGSRLAKGSEKGTVVVGRGRHMIGMRPRFPALKLRFIQG